MTSRLDAIKARAEAASHANHTTTMNYNAVYSVVWRSHQDIPALVAAVEAALNMPGEVVECGYPLDSEWASGYTAALVDVRAVIRQALGEGEQ